MLILLIIAGVVSGLALYLFFAPLYLEVNSNTGLFRIRLHRLASVSLKIEERIYIETNVLGWKKKSEMILYQERRRDNKPAEASEAQSKRTLPAISRKKLISLLKSFKVNTCRVTIDTGDMQWNGMLYPALYWLGWYSGRPIGISFVGRNEIILEIRNSIARMSWALISST